MNGNDALGRKRFVVSRDLNHQDMETRLAVGKKGEADIIRTLRAAGLPVYDVNNDDDRFSKIDARIVVNQAAMSYFPVLAFHVLRGTIKEGVTLCAQVKDRQNYPDYEYELYTDRYERNGKGRELKSKALLMVCRSNGTIEGAWMPGLHAIAQALYNRNPEAFQRDEQFTQASKEWGAELKRVEDKRDGFWKTICYVKKMRTL